VRKNKQDILEDETISVDLSEYDAIFKAMEKWHDQESALLKSCYGTAVENNNKLALENNRLNGELEKANGYLKEILSGLYLIKEKMNIP